MTLSDLDQIEQRAMNATFGGPWRTGRVVTSAVFVEGEGKQPRVATCDTDEVAEHIAANSPSVTLALCALARKGLAAEPVCDCKGDPYDLECPKHGDKRFP